MIRAVCECEEIEMELIDLDGRTTRGRQKIEIKKIEAENDRLVTFSKRRSIPFLSLLFYSNDDVVYG